MAPFHFHNPDDGDFRIVVIQHDSNAVNTLQYDRMTLVLTLFLVIESSIPKSQYLTMDVIFPINNKSTFTILTMNIASFASNLQKFLDQILSISNVDFDVIGLAEPRLNNDIAPLDKIPNYMMHGMHRNRRGTGVALYVRDSLTSMLLQDMCMCERSYECACVEAVCGDYKYFLASVYRPSNGNIPDFIH